jgi:hypothetical protein
VKRCVGGKNGVLGLKRHVGVKTTGRGSKRHVGGGNDVWWV